MSVQRALELARKLYWDNEQPKLGRTIENLLIVLEELAEEPSDAPLAFWLGREGCNPLDGTRLWDKS